MLKTFSFYSYSIPWGGSSGSTLLGLQNEFWGDVYFVEMIVESLPSE